ncbi:MULTISPECIES: aryl-sulfate sulfotransferase [unclassified Sphingobacterium]|uniref:aryl-sulfate sulfotransferase n=1 Tax=unclassified Sphingobacterium TaxID=2609468 RepID=UPI0010DD1EDC|nr:MULTISPECIES: aryl-sulfate sulfotransferase [unclassified Sphingobacterium]MCS3557212.1 arylsulfate sulfotransferase [Sphingobacterium sp. JUb21]TCQ97213.1 arylsulfate sulfotransferase [Sphingobacterium sp. JUb20]
MMVTGRTQNNIANKILIIILLIILLSSCAKDKATPIIIASQQSLSSKIDAGELLINISKNEDYIFTFEKETLRIPLQDISKIEAELDRWRTKIIFRDGSELIVPTKGTELDYIVEKIKLNPSGYNPLAALVDVWLPTYGRIKVTVKGKNSSIGTITHLCQENAIRQSVPILGLYPDHDNLVDLTYTDMEGKERGSTQIHIRTAAISLTDFPKWKKVKALPEKMEPGMNLINYPGMSEADVSLPYMLDSEGELRWLLLLKSSPDLQKLSTSIGLKRTKKGTFIAGDQAQARVVEIDMFGNLKRQWDLQKLGYGFHHEITESNNGNFLITVTKTGARLRNGEPRVNDHIIELNPESGTLVTEWDLAHQLDTSRYIKPDGITPPLFSQTPNNWAHNNAIGEIGNDLLATLRYQGIVSFNHSGSLRWIISPHKLWKSQYHALLLNPIAEDGTPVTDPAVINGDAQIDGFDWPWGPHTPVAIANDRILVFDNGYDRNWISNSIPSRTNYSRIVEYKIDVANKTVQQLWSYGKERGAKGFSLAVSGVQYLKQTGNVLFCPGMGVSTSLGTGGRIMEINPKTKEILFELEIAANSGFAFHRVTRMPLYPENY